MPILTLTEQAEFDTPPVFNNGEREQFFHVSESLKPLLTTLRTPVNQFYFLLILGYFKATNRFFMRQFHQADIEYVERRLGFLPGLIDPDSYDEKATYHRHQKLILDYLGCREFNEQARQEILQEIRAMVRS
jgi:hypothetical protein